jgi:hypothetical protein
VKKSVRTLFALDAQKILANGMPILDARIAEKRFPKLPLGIPSTKHNISFFNLTFHLDNFLTNINRFSGSDGSPLNQSQVRMSMKYSLEYDSAPIN